MMFLSLSNSMRAYQLMASNKTSWCMLSNFIVTIDSSHSQPLTTTRNHSQPLTTTHNYSQQLTTTHNHSQPLTTTHNHSQPLTTTHNHSQPFTTTHNPSQLSATTQSLKCFLTDHNHSTSNFFQSFSTNHT